MVRSVIIEEFLLVVRRPAIMDEIGYRCGNDLRRPRGRRRIGLDAQYFMRDAAALDRHALEIVLHHLARRGRERGVGGLLGLELHLYQEQRRVLVGQERIVRRQRRVEQRHLSAGQRGQRRAIVPLVVVAELDRIDARAVEHDEIVDGHVISHRRAGQGQGQFSGAPCPKF